MLTPLDALGLEPMDRKSHDGSDCHRRGSSAAPTSLQGSIGLGSFPSTFGRESLGPAGVSNLSSEDRFAMPAGANRAVSLSSTMQYTTHGKLEAASGDGEVACDGKSIQDGKDIQEKDIQDGKDVEPRRPGSVDLSHTKSNNAAPASLTAARFISDINTVQYPEGVFSPRADLNENAEEGKFRSVYYISACLQNLNCKNL